MVSIEKPTSQTYTDVSSTDWFYAAVNYVTDSGLMNGVGNGKFAPSLSASRGMIVTILHRLEDTPAVSTATSFADVKPDSYYANEATWASENGIVSGYGNGNFGPDDEITREQLVTILYRYAKFKNYDVNIGEDTNISRYDDASQISEYAYAPMQWAISVGLITGRSATTLAPHGTVMRAEIAMILIRFDALYRR